MHNREKNINTKDFKDKDLIINKYKGNLMTCHLKLVFLVKLNFEIRS